MRLLGEDLIKQVQSKEEMQIAYDRKTDTLYLSPAATREFGYDSIIRKYWMESVEWHCIEAKNQEALVRKLRNTPPGVGPVCLEVPIKGKDSDSFQLYLLELHLQWAQESIRGIEIVTGRIQKQ